jgi:HEAT repeat protein
VLARGLGARERYVRRATFRLARDSHAPDRIGLLRRALRDSDTLIRVEAVADTRRHLSADELLAVLPVIVADSYPPVRREGIAAAAEHLADGAATWLTSSLLDHNKSVREIARFFLGRCIPAMDFAAYYRERLSDAGWSSRLASSLAGLGETGGAADAPLVLPYLEHERPAVRQASMRALAALDLAGQLPRIVGMLSDPAPSVSHAARKVLRPRVGHVGPDPLTSVFRTAPYAHSRFDALALGVGLGKWDSLPILLEATADRDERIRTSARVWLSAWIAKQNRSFAQPTAGQIQAIHTALDVHRFAIDANVANELRSILRYWTKSSANDASR